MDAHVMEPVKALIRRQHAALKRRLTEGESTPSDMEQIQVTFSLSVGLRGGCPLRLSLKSKRMIDRRSEWKRRTTCAS